MKLFVWDFHGVLEKGNDSAVTLITNRVLDEHGYSRRMTEQESFSLSGKRWHEYFSYLLPEIEQAKCIELQSACFKISEGNPGIIASHIQLNDYAEDVLQSIHNTEHKQILISNTTPASLKIFVDVVGVNRFFPSSHYFGVNSHTQSFQTKRDCLEDFLEGCDEVKMVISIGDSPGDMAMVDDNFHIQAKRYLYSHPNKKHREAPYDHRIHDLRLVLQEIE